MTNAITGLCFMVVASNFGDRTPDFLPPCQGAVPAAPILNDRRVNHAFASFSKCRFAFSSTASCGVGSYS